MEFGKPIQPIQPKKSVGPFRRYQFIPPKSPKGINISNFTKDIYKVKITDLRNLNLKNLSFALDKFRKNYITNTMNNIKNSIVRNLNYYTIQVTTQIKQQTTQTNNILSFKDMFGFINKDFIYSNKNMKLIYDSFISKIINSFDKEILSPTTDYFLLFSFIEDYFRLFKLNFDKNTDEEYKNVINNINQFLVDKVKYSIDKILNDEFLSEEYYTTSPIGEILYQMNNIDKMIKSIQNNILIWQESNNYYNKNNKLADFSDFLSKNILSFINGPAGPILSFIFQFGSILYDLFSKADEYKLQSLNLKRSDGKIKTFDELTKKEKKAIEFFADNMDIDKRELYKYITNYQKILNVYKLYSNFIYINSIDK